MYESTVSSENKVYLHEHIDVKGWDTCYLENLYPTKREAIYYALQKLKKNQKFLWKKLVDTEREIQKYQDELDGVLF